MAAAADEFPGTGALISHPQRVRNRRATGPRVGPEACAPSTKEPEMAGTLTVWKFPTATGADTAVSALGDLQRRELITVQEPRW